MDSTLYLPERVYSSTLSGNELAVYSVINMLCSGMSWANNIYVSLDAIAYYLNISKRTASEHYSSLIDNGVIKATGNVVDVSSVLKHREEHFVTIPVDTFFKIMRDGNTQLYMYFVQLMSTRNNKLKVSYQKIEYIEDLTGLSKSTILRYNKKLEDIGVLYIRRSHNLKQSDGSVYSDNNVYGLVADKAAVDKYADENEYKVDMHNSNWQRMVTAKYNAYIKNPNSYEDTDALYKLCEEYNALMDELQRKHPGSNYIKKKKNLDALLF